MHWLSIVDLVCALPVMIEMLGLFSQKAATNIYVFRFLMMVRTIRMLQLYRLLRLAKTAKMRQGLVIGLTAACIIICAAATFQVRCRPDWVYGFIYLLFWRWRLTCLLLMGRG